MQVVSSTSLSIFLLSLLVSLHFLGSFIPQFSPHSFSTYLFSNTILSDSGKRHLYIKAGKPSRIFNSPVNLFPEYPLKESFPLSTKGELRKCIRQRKSTMKQGHAWVSRKHLSRTSQTLESKGLFSFSCFLSALRVWHQGSLGRETHRRLPALQDLALK